MTYKKINMRTFILTLTMLWSSHFSPASGSAIQLTGFWHGVDSVLHFGSCKTYPAVSSCISQSSLPLTTIEKTYIADLEFAYQNKAQNISVGLNAYGETPRPGLANTRYFQNKLRLSKLFFDAMKNGLYNGPVDPESDFVANPNIDDVLVLSNKMSQNAAFNVEVPNAYTGLFGDTLFRVPLDVTGDNSPISVTPHLAFSKPVDIRLPLYLELSSCPASMSILGIIARNGLNPHAFYFDGLARDTSRTNNILSMRVALKRSQGDIGGYPKCELVAKVVPSVDCYERIDRSGCYDRTFAQCRWDVRTRQCYGANYMPWGE